jgi:hypothetical protein
VRNSLLRAWVLACFTVLAPAAFAQVNYGDFPGTSVDFMQVSELTLSSGDPASLWGAPSLAGSGDQLVFFPPNFTSTCASGGSDVTQSQLTTTITAHTGGHIDNIMLAENGDATLTTFPPFGNAGTNVSAAVSGSLTVTEDISGPITPVVILFTGTYTPSSTFALPTNFGTQLWTDTVTVNVSGSVANATKAILTLNNNLATNCAAGNTTAKIQKKVVSGPSVAILVNPITCNLQIDKTCCVTRPVPPDLDVCDGHMRRLLLEYTGESCGHSSCDQGGAFQCNGHRGLGEPATIQVINPDIVATPSTDVHIGDVVELKQVDGVDFGAKTRLKVSDSWWRREYLKIDTSCERAIACGDQLGAFKVVGVESTGGGFVDCSAPPPPPECAPSGDPEGTQCNGPVVDMVFEYHGQACQDPLPNPQGGYSKCTGDATGATNVGIIYTGPYGYKQKISPASGLNDGDRFRVSSTQGVGGLNGLQSYKIIDSGGVRQKVDLKASCQQPLALGDQFGSLKLVEFTTKNGQHVALGAPIPPADACEVPLAPPGPHCTSDLRGLTLVYIGNYLGAGCTVSNAQGGYGTCSGVADPGDPVSVSSTSPLNLDPDSLIEFGDLVSLTPNSSGDMPDLTNLTVTGAGGSQTIQIKTSCYKPLSLGDRFGSFVVFGMDREEDGPISLGGNIQYQYKVTNPNASTVDNVQVTDDQLGVIASGVSIPAGGSQTFVKPATLYGTTTNVATATGDVSGNICAPGTDQVTVSVLAPPQGAFNCSEPIHELTLIWNGNQTVDIRVWSGAENVSTLLDSFDDVAPGQAITVSGFGSSYPTYEIFNSTGTVKLGESTFDLWCNDPSMNGVEDCGKNEGNLKYDYSYLNNDWLLEGMVDSNETLSCTPGLVPNPPACGFGPELIVVMPGLLWLHRRRLRKEA